MIDRLQHFINGAWIDDPQAETFVNEDPSHRGSVLNRVPDASAATMDRAITSAAAAAREWRRTPLATRQARIERFLELLQAQRDTLAGIVTRENGKTLKEARGEVDSALLEGRYHCRQVAAFFGQPAPRGDADVAAWEQFHPLGVVGVISPWNYPLNVMCRKTLPALLTGNTVVFKPASFTPWSAVFMAGLFEQAGLPAGVFNCVTGKGGRIGNQLVQDPRVRAISFTGSTAVGRQIQQMAAANFTRTQLELGGKNALIVLADADLDAAVEATRLAGFGCAGQWCTSTSRVLLHEAIAEAFLEKLCSRADSLVVGDPLNEATDMGPVAGPAQFKGISAAIAKAISEGARRRSGNAAVSEEGYYIRPTVFDRVTPEMALFREEVFGPVIAATTFTSLPEALALTKRSEYGLSSALFTNDMSAALTYVREIDAGMAHVNIHTGFKTPELPFGGWKESGFGPPENSRTGLEFFVERKAVYLKGF